MGFWDSGGVERLREAFCPEVEPAGRWRGWGCCPRTCYKMERLGVFFGGRRFAPQVVLPQNLLEDREVGGVFLEGGVLPQKWFCPRTCWKMERLGMFFGGRCFAPEPAGRWRGWRCFASKVVLPQNLLEDREVGGVFWREAFCPRTYILLSLELQECKVHEKCSCLCMSALLDNLELQ